jgi:hypothetical protein
MTEAINRPLADYAAAAMKTRCPPGALALAEALATRFAASSVLLYGSGISAAAQENPADILYDFYVIAPDYRVALPHAVERFAARALPPNVYYFEADTALGRLRCKYALLSIAHYERLVSPATFHSYFWARFAQPCRIVVASALDARIANAVSVALERFLSASAPLAGEGAHWRAVWLAGLKVSYRAELRAEGGGRAESLLAHYGEWPAKTFELARARAAAAGPARLAWRARQAFGAALSVARLLKATTTFQGGIDYIAWKIKRHTGVDVAVKPWERRHPFIAAPIVARRYYQLRAARAKGA